MVESTIVAEYEAFELLISPSYLLESPYLEILIAVARGDGKLYSVLRKAKLSEVVGLESVGFLCEKGVLSLESSRQAPLKQHPKQKLKKSLRSYRIQDKLRFRYPFIRFWFGFVAPYASELRRGEGRGFLRYFAQHQERLASRVYEELSNALLVAHYQQTTPLVTSGSYWDHHSEFDILARTTEGQVILGECKYKDRKVCKNELTKLKLKAQQSGIRVDTYALFSKEGFSKELLSHPREGLLLFDLEGLRQLL